MSFTKSLFCQKFVVHSLLDPGLDLEKSDTDKYRETLEASHLVALEGQTLDTFTLKPLDARQKTTLQGMYADLGDLAGGITKVQIQALFEINLLAIRMSLIEGPIPLESKEGLVTEACLLSFMFEDMITELGQYVYQVSQLPFLEAAGRG